METPNLRTALIYASYGVKVFPCQESGSRAKAPYTANGFYAATANAEEIRAWWLKNPQALVSMPCRINNILTMDADRHGSLDGVQKLDELFIQHGFNKATTPCVVTPTANGEHYIFRRPQSLGDTVGNLADCIDVKDNGYIIAAGSVLPDGRTYALKHGTIEQLAHAIANGLLPLLPDSLTALIAKPVQSLPTPGTPPISVENPVTSPSENYAGLSEYVRAAIREEAEKLAGAKEGQRNNRLNSSTFSIATMAEPEGVKREDVEPAFRSACMRNGLIMDGNDTEFRRTFENAWRNGETKPRESVAAREARLAQGVTIVADTPVSTWPKPMPLPKGLLPVAAFNPDFLPDCVRPWVMDTVEPMQCPPDFMGISVLIALAATIGRQIGIKPLEKGDWLVTPNLWGMIVGRPGVLKSPAMEEAIAPLRMLEAAAKKDYNEAMSQYRLAEEEYSLRKKATNKKVGAELDTSLNADVRKLLELKEPVEPKRKRHIVTDTTYEALGEILAHNSNGVLAYRDELVSLLKTLDREENVAARGFFMSGWNGSDGYTFDRIIRGRTDIEAVCISMLGATQPGKLSSYIAKALRGGDGDDGLIQRFNLLVWPDQSGEWKNVDRHPDTEARSQAFRRFQTLSNLNASDVTVEFDGYKTRMYVRYDSDAQECFNAWREQHEQRLRSDNFHPALESHFAKYRSLIPSMALIYNLCDRTGTKVSLPDIVKAIEFSKYLEAHALRAYSAAIRQDVDTARAILKHIKNCNLSDGFTLREIHQHGWSGLTDHEQVKEGLSTLVEYNWLSAEKDANTGGRPTYKYRINPRIAEM